jgi:hypothetical protein
MRFSIRDLLWATLVVALCIAWWLDHQPPEAYTEERVRQWLAKNTWTVQFLPEAEGHFMEFDEWITEGNSIPGVEPVLRKLLASRDPSVELPMVAMALGRLGGAESVPVLIDCLGAQEIYPNPKTKGNTSSEQTEADRARGWAMVVRWQAARALGRLRTKRAIQPLGQLLSVERSALVRANAIRALIEIGGPDAITYLRGATNDQDAAVAKEAKSGLKRLATTEPTQFAN